MLTEYCMDALRDVGKNFGLGKNEIDDIPGWFRIITFYNLPNGDIDRYPNVLTIYDGDGQVLDSTSLGYPKGGDCMNDTLWLDFYQKFDSINLFTLGVNGGFEFSYYLYAWIISIVILLKFGYIHITTEYDDPLVNDLTLVIRAPE